MAKNISNSSIQSIVEAEQKLKRERQKLIIPCSHTKKGGEKLNLNLVDDNTGETIAKCNQCGTKFSLTPVREDELRDAVMVIHDAVNQLKIYSEDPKAEAKMIEALGNIDFNVLNLPEMYKTAVEQYSGKKKKKRRNNSDDNYGSYGGASLFGSGRRR